MKGIVVFFGNDGTGKSTLAKAILTEGFLGVERNLVPESLKEVLVPSSVDRLTLEYPETWPQVWPVPSEVMYEGEILPVISVILDAEVEVSVTRISSRPGRDVWETPKALKYFRSRFLELAAWYGIPVIRTDTQGEAETAKAVTTASRRLPLGNLTPELINQYNPEKNEEFLRRAAKVVPASQLETGFLPVRPEFFARWLAGGTWSRQGDFLTASRQGIEVSIPWPRNQPVLTLFLEGESKRLYRVLGDSSGLVIIQLKPSIYSHSRQATGDIVGLEKVRASGTRWFLEMMWRNGITHAYRAINSFGLIVADYVGTPSQPGSCLEVVVKQDFVGTDKHSYYGFPQVNPDGKYPSGPYVRFDWRNPNHLLKSTGLPPSSNPYYYLAEEGMGKEEFFKTYLTPEAGLVTPVGDKVITADLIESMTDLTATRLTALRLLTTMSWYLGSLGVEIKDFCFMVSLDGQTVYSELNQDCMRLVPTSSSESSSYDKDLWRAGGSSASGLILAKWGKFNSMLGEWFRNHLFHETEQKSWHTYPYQTVIRNLLKTTPVLPSYRYLYQTLLRPKDSVRKVICTLDLFEGKPVLVNQGRVTETHSEGSVNRALSMIDVFPDILVVDLDGAFGVNPSTCRPVIRTLATKYYVHTGGGIRTLEDVQDLLSHSARRVVISSNVDPAFLAAIPKSRLVVELSVNARGEVLTHGRTVNTGIQAASRLEVLAEAGVEAVSFTFHQAEGRLEGIPREQISSLVLQTPESIRKIIIAGGITTEDDLEFLWSIPRVVPALGSALWKGALTPGALMASMARYDSAGLISTVVQDEAGRVKGLVWSSPKSLRRTADTRQLWRFSREGGLMLKGATSDRIQKVVKMTFDCDQDSILVTVASEPDFCHLGGRCFNDQSVTKSSLAVIQEHVRRSMSKPTYSGRMQANPSLALAKVLEEFWEMMVAKNSKSHSVEECSDMLVHFVMYLSGMGIDLSDVTNELNARRWNPHLLPAPVRAEPTSVVVGITAAKYEGKTDRFCESRLGFRPVRGTGRSLSLTYEVVNPELFREVFGGRTVGLMAARPKNLPFLMSSGRIDYCVSYNTVFVNQPGAWTEEMSEPDSDLILALICREGEEIDTNSWSQSKPLIATEHPTHVHNYLTGLGIDPHHFSLDRIDGCSESYLVIEGLRRRYDLCDAIVQSGATLRENKLKIWNVVLPKGEVKVCLYRKV